MGGANSRLVVVEKEMMNVSDFNLTCYSVKSGIPTMYPTSLEEGCLVNGKTDSCNGVPKRHTYVTKPDDDGHVSMISKAESVSSDSSSLSSREFPHFSQGQDALATLNPSPSSHLHSTPKRNGNPRGKDGNAQAAEVSFSSNQGSVICSRNDRNSTTCESSVPDENYCNCDHTAENSSCEVIVTTHESVVSKKILGPTTLRRSCSMSDEILLQTAKQKPKWKIEVEMESTRVIYGALKRDQSDSFVLSDPIPSGDSKLIDTKDESTATDGLDGFVVLCDGEGEDLSRSHEHTDEQKRKKTFWAKKKKRRHLYDKEKSSNLASQNGGTLRHLNFWPFGKSSNSANDMLSPSPRQRLLRQSIYEEKLKYLHIAARVNCPRAADVRATLLVETPSVKLTNAQLSTKTYLLNVTLNAFFYPYPKVYVEWVDSLSDIIQERMKLGDIMPKFVTADVSDCRVCLILSPDASVLLCNPTCALIPDLANIAGYSRKSTFVMEAIDERDRDRTDVTAATPENFAPIYEIEEFEEESLNVNCNRNLAQTL